MKKNGNIKNEESMINEMSSETHPLIFIGIDPGKNGGVAVINEVPDHEGTISFRCPKKPVEMAYTLMATIPNHVSYEDVFVNIEHVHAMPNNGVVSMFSFGQNLGQWEGILGAFELNVKYITPRAWMDHYDCQPRMDKKERKRYLRNIAETLFPNIKMTFNISDALLIANYNKDIYYKELASMQGRNRVNSPA